MVNREAFSGVIVPMVTPFTADGEIDKPAVRRIIDHLCDAGVAGVFVSGTTGESASIAMHQKKELAAIAVDFTNKRAKVYAGISDNCFSCVVQAAETYFDLGVDAVVAHVPHYYSLEGDEICRYFVNVADHINGPLMLYNIPKTTHTSIPIETVERLSHHRRIVGLKDSENDLVRMESLLKMFAAEDGFSYVLGCAPMSFKALTLGAAGIVPSTGNIVPGMYQQLYEKVRLGDQAAGQELQDRTNRVSLVYQHNRSLGQSLAALKMMMSMLGLCGPTMLPPLKALTEQEKADIIDQMKKFQLIS